MRGHKSFVRLTLLAASVSQCGLIARGDDGSATVDFARDIRPIFESHCYECHGPEHGEAGLRLNLKSSAFTAADSGHKPIDSSKPSASRLLKVLNGTDDDGLRMPPEDGGEPLTPEQVALVAKWIDAGANWPAEGDAAQAKSKHWAWSKPVKANVPAIAGNAQSHNPIDAFVADRLQREGLGMSTEADRHTLIRRVHLDLIGLPPPPQAVDEFINDPSADAYEKMVDRLLTDPAYGERWARMWLDLARYADSKGYGSDPLRTIWRYRDWVIEAFNRNLPYDQFTIEQLAGDLLPGATPEQILATAFHRNTMANDEGGTIDEEFRVAAVKDRAETTAQVWMGLTMGCAKCHSHKFDPITQREYYQFYACFNQTEDADRQDENPKIPSPTRDHVAEWDRLKSELAKAKETFDTAKIDLATSQASWEQRVAEQAASWKPLEFVERTAQSGATIEPAAAGALVVGGAAADTDIYTLKCTAALTDVTALRLEVLPHDSLPNKGPGRGATGNIVLNELKIEKTRPASQSIAGRFVRVEMLGDKSHLSLAEVQVFAGDKNLATAGKASQSSTAYDGAAERAIDNNTDGEYYHGNSVTHTGDEVGAWWEVDLGSVSPVDRILIWNRVDPGPRALLTNVRVSLLDNERQPIWDAKIDSPPNPSVEFLPNGPQTVEIASATASYEQPDFGVAKAFDTRIGKTSGWGVSGHIGKATDAIFKLAKPLSVEPGATLTLTLLQVYPLEMIGHFRISVSTLPAPVAVVSPIDELLAIPTAQRSAEQLAAITTYYRTIAPEAAELRNNVAKATDQLANFEKQIPTTPILRELPADKRRKTHMMIKGNYVVLGEEVEPALPAALVSETPTAPLDRLQVAKWLVGPDNALTARVTVNRFWSQLFGRGLVETEEDFGTQGLPPTHPELLDWLAVEFRDTLHWDVKQLLRLIVTSATYRQTSFASPELMHKDSLNKLYARGPRHRLEAEMVRDQALAIGGLLSRKVGGASVYPPQPDGLWRAAFNGERTWTTSLGEDRYRRGLYTYWRRTVPYPSMATFDAPSREICTLRRMPTNTPLQAFVTLNDPVYVECAQALARRMMRETSADATSRAAYGLKLCLARPAQPQQIDAIVKLVEQELQLYKADPAAAKQLATEPLGPLPEGVDVAEAAAWTVAANVMLNLDGVLSNR